MAEEDGESAEEEAIEPKYKSRIEATIRCHVPP